MVEPSNTYSNKNTSPKTKDLLAYTSSSRKILTSKHYHNTNNNLKYLKCSKRTPKSSSKYIDVKWKLSGCEKAQWKE